MDLKQAIKFKDKKKKEGLKSDGCTFSPDFWIRECCEVHDFLLHFDKCSRFRADWVYFLLMLKKAFPLAPVYYAGVTSRTFYVILTSSPWFDKSRQ